MSPTALTRDQVHAAMDRLVEAFAATDTERYFAALAPSATFVLHTEASPLRDRAAYERLWDAWRADGWRVEECDSTDRHVQLHGSTAVVTHDVRTVTSVGGVRTETRERETVVLALVDDALLVVHEHLSARPDVPAGTQPHRPASEGAS